MRAYRAPMVRAWTFVAVLAALAAALWVGILMSLGPFERPFSVPWWALIPLVFLAESAVIHVTFRKDAHSFSLSEIVLIVGLFLSSPAALLVAQVIGNSASLVLGRRQVPIKVAFNVSQLVLVTGLATVVFRVLVNMGDPLGPTGWLAAIAASVASIVVAELAINTVIRLTGGNMSRGEMLETMVLGSIGASLNAALGLIAVFIAWYDPRSVWLATVPPLLMYVAYRTHAVQRNHHKHLESMHAVTEAIHTAPDLAAALVDAAGSARELVAADWLEIVVFMDEELRPYQTIVQLKGLEAPMVPSSLVNELPPWWQSVIGDAESAIVHEASWSGVEGSPPITKDVIVAPIVGTERLHGYVLAADRLGDVNVFGTADIQLLETVAKQVSVALDNGRLETSLATVTALKEQLEGMVRSKDQFVASVSHELRTPLTAVVGFAEQLEQNLEIFEHSDLKEFIGLIAHESSTLSHIIEDLLVAARADIGTLAIHAESIDATQAVQDLMDLSPTSSGTSPITVRGEPAQAWADPVRFRQVVRNLLTNAQRYGGDDIGIDIEERGHVITITVFDNGPGVPEGRERLIFEAYERGHEESTQPGSVGLGLAVSRQLARMMGGDLAYSRHHSTTRFEFTVPTFVDDGCRGSEPVAGDPEAVGVPDHL
ncbi:MAG: HAMP domain-containing histidine kinase [bacterium]|nr:HAMP domain-containing histidine kinase [bacterium]